MRELLRFASTLQVNVHVAHIDDDPGLLGYYNDERRTIVLRIDLTPIEMRSVLAHELAHAFFRDDCTTGVKERRAERYAATLIIRPDLYVRAEMIDPNPWAIAEELGVTVDLVRSYQRDCLQRLGTRTYGRPLAYIDGSAAYRLSS